MPFYFPTESTLSDFDLVDRLADVSRNGLQTAMRSFADRSAIIQAFDASIQAAGISEHHYHQLHLVLAGSDGFGPISQTQQIALSFLKQQNPEDLKKVGTLADAYAQLLAKTPRKLGNLRMANSNFRAIAKEARRIASLPGTVQSEVSVARAASISNRARPILARLSGIQILMIGIGLAVFHQFAFSPLSEGQNFSFFNSELI